MHLGKDFVFIAHLIMTILRALLQMLESKNDDSDGDGKEIQ